MIKLNVIACVGTEPQSKTLENGNKLTYFSVCVNYRRKGQDCTQWINVSTFGDQFDQLMPFITKGSHVYLFGSFEVFPHREDRTKTIWSLNPDVIKLTYHKKKVEPDYSEPEYMRKYTQEKKEEKSNTFEITDEEIPF